MDPEEAVFQKEVSCYSKDIGQVCHVACHCSFVAAIVSSAMNIAGSGKSHRISIWDTKNRVHFVDELFSSRPMV